MYSTTPFNFDSNQARWLHSGLHLVQVSGKLLLLLDTIGQILFPNNWDLHPPAKTKSNSNAIIQDMQLEEKEIGDVLLLYLAFFNSEFWSLSPPPTTKQFVSAI